MKFLVPLLCAAVLVVAEVQDDSKQVAEAMKEAVKENMKEDKTDMKAPHHPSRWTSLIKTKIQTAEAFTALLHKQNIKPEILNAVNISAEVDHHIKEGLNTQLAFEGEDGTMEYGLIQTNQLAPFTDYFKGIRFHFFNKYDEKDEKGVVLSPEMTPKEFMQIGWDPKLPLKVIIHGFTNSITSPIIQKLKNAYLKTGKYNVVGVDWGQLCPAPFYVTSRVHVSGTGAKVGEFLDSLIKKNLTEKSLMHVIGHSLGAHVAGISGKSMNTDKPNRITGLDPAGPLFQFTGKDGKIYKTDAEIVDIYHTNAGTLGKSESLGSVDFYPNGGRSQPGCWVDIFGSCAHSRSFELFAYSILNPKKMRGYYCSDLPARDYTCAALRGHTPTALFGNDVEFEKGGNYHLYTGTAEPFEEVIHTLGFNS